MAIWHTPKIAGIRLNGQPMLLVSADNPVPLRYYPQQGGGWSLDLVLVAPGVSPNGLFGTYSGEQKTKLKGIVLTPHMAVEALLDDETGGAGAKSIATGAALGMAVAGPLGAMAGAALGAKGSEIPLKLATQEGSPFGTTLELLVVASGNLYGGFKSNLALQQAREVW